MTPSEQSSLWNAWYRLACTTLGYEHEEAAEYANRRLVEDQNRALLRPDDPPRLAF